jgi:anti-sigma regulatory factor (Ser/Thr protein kinase)/ActR/RegA family two-component response regulator
MTPAPQFEPNPSPIKQALLVGGDSELLSLLASVLDPVAWAILQVPNNAAALSAAEKDHFDLILTDEKTSGREDVELLRKIRRVRPHTRLIILTSESTPEDVIASMRARAFSYFSRPFCLNELGAMIQHAAEEPCWDDGIEVVSATPELIRTLVRCDLKTAGRLLQFLDEIAELPDQERHDVAQAFREMLINAIEHGGQLDPAKRVEIEYVRARRMVSCRINDPGPGFRRDELPHAAIENPADDPLRHMEVREELGLRPGGFGILLTRHLVDQLIYSEEGNEVVLVKYLAAARSSAGPE